jgi:hypothetical protein
MEWMRAYLTAGCLPSAALSSWRQRLGAFETVDATQRRSCGEAMMTHDKMLVMRKRSPQRGACDKTKCAQEDMLFEQVHLLEMQLLPVTRGARVLPAGRIPVTSIRSSFLPKRARDATSPNNQLFSITTLNQPLLSVSSYFTL